MFSEDVKIFQSSIHAGAKFCSTARVKGSSKLIGLAIALTFGVLPKFLKVRKMFDTQGVLDDYFRRRKEYL
jgi:hypothetical protein